MYVTVDLFLFYTNALIVGKVFEHYAFTLKYLLNSPSSNSFMTKCSTFTSLIYFMRYVSYIRGRQV